MRMGVCVCVCSDLNRSIDDNNLMCTFFLLFRILTYIQSGSDLFLWGKGGGIFHNREKTDSHHCF